MEYCCTAKPSQQLLVKAVLTNNSRSFLNKYMNETTQLMLKKNQQKTDTNDAISPECTETESSSLQNPVSVLACSSPLHLLAARIKLFTLTPRQYCKQSNRNTELMAYSSFVNLD